MKRGRHRRATHDSPVIGVQPSLEGLALDSDWVKCGQCEQWVPEAEHLVYRCGEGEQELIEPCDGPYIEFRAKR